MVSIKLILLLGGLFLMWDATSGGRVRRVVGGRQMAMGAWPWLVSLNFLEHHDYLSLQGLDHLCGGTLIHSYWVITAAHCVHRATGAGLGEADNWLAVLGEYNRRVTEQSEQRIQVARIFVSSNYSFSPNLTGDIALLKLARPAMVTQSVMPISIDASRDIPAGTECKTAGWGQHVADLPGGPQYGNGTLVPHVIETAKVATNRCQEAYRSSWPLIDDSVLCFQSSERKDACQGDSGGPLVCSNEAGVLTLTGIVSIGRGCALPNFPGVYTRVSEYRNWILSTIRQHTTIAEQDVEFQQLADRQILRL